MDNIGRAESLIQASGCGPFQLLVVFLVYCVIKIPSTCTMMFMSYGNYNPGWRCLDNHTISDNDSINTNTDSLGDLVGNYVNMTLMTVTSNATGVSYIAAGGGVDVGDGGVDVGYGYNYNGPTIEGLGMEYSQGACPDYEACQRVEFEPGTSTIVTEWGLLCDRNWVISLIIAIQMAGLLVGSLVSGYFGDTLGRKKVLYVALALNGVFNAVSVFLESWQLFAAVRFLFGVVLACIMGGYCVLPQEFLNTKRRGRMFPLPTWALGGLVMSVTVMLCPDWRIIHAIFAAMSFAFCLTALWVPESLRWLEIKGREKEFDKVAKKITSLNKVSLPAEFQKEAKVSFIDSQCKPSTRGLNVERVTLMDLFRKGYRLSTLIVGVVAMVSSMIYYGIGFGVKAMSGNFYVNLIVNYTIEFPVSIFPIILPNIIGRKRASISFMAVTACCLVTTACLEVWAEGDTRRVGTMVLALLAKSIVDASWYILMSQTAEIYPTSVRSIATGFASKFGGILAPFLIPKDAETVYICYIVMAALSVVCCLATGQLPETKGKRLKETFGEE